MIRGLALAIAASLVAAPALAQHAGHHPSPAGPAADPHAGHVMPTPAADPHAGHVMPAPAVDPHAGHAMPAPAVDPHAGRAMPAAAADPHAGHSMPAPPPTTGPAAPQPVPATYADRIWGAEAMARARAALRRDHGGARFAQVLVDEAEVVTGGGEDGYRWDIEAAIGGDSDGLVVKSEGEGRFGGNPEVELQALWRHAIGPYFDLQAGVRHDFGPDPERSYATLGVEGLAPYWFEVEAALFLSDKGDLLGRIEIANDQRITQALILQPRAEIALAAQDVAASGIGAGLSEIELGARLRYEIVREFAPYVGIAWSRKLGDTARFARAEGEGADALGFVAGVRVWF